MQQATRPGTFRGTTGARGPKHDKLPRLPPSIPPAALALVAIFPPITLPVGLSRERLYECRFRFSVIPVSAGKSSKIRVCARPRMVCFLSLFVFYLTV